MNVVFQQRERRTARFKDRFPRFPPLQSFLVKVGNESWPEPFFVVEPAGRLQIARPKRKLGIPQMSKPSTASNVVPQARTRKALPEYRLRSEPTKAS